jgi:hypothetical protein
MEVNKIKLNKFGSIKELVKHLVDTGLESEPTEFQECWYDILVFYFKHEMELPESLSECVNCAHEDQKSPPFNELTLVMYEYFYLYGRGVSYSYYSDCTEIKSRIKSIEGVIERNDLDEYVKTGYKLLCKDHLVLCEREDCGHLAVEWKLRLVGMKRWERKYCKLHFLEQLEKELKNGTSPELKDISYSSPAYHLNERGELGKWRNNASNAVIADIKRVKLIRSLTENPVIVPIKAIKHNIKIKKTK